MVPRQERRPEQGNECLLLPEVRWLDIRVSRRVWSSVVDEEGFSLAVVLVVVVAFIFVLLVVGQADSKLAVEERNVA
jgi:hypothetical protein